MVVRFLTPSRPSFTLRVGSLRGPYRYITVVIPDAHQGFVSCGPSSQKPWRIVPGREAATGRESNLVSGLKMVVEMPEMITQVICQEKTLIILPHRLTGNF